MCKLTWNLTVALDLFNPSVFTSNTWEPHHVTIGNLTNTLLAVVAKPCCTNMLTLGLVCTPAVSGTPGSRPDS
jgi:hypothetical protein